MTAREGETAEFACRLTPCMPPPAVVWYFEAVGPSSPGCPAQLLSGPRYRLSYSPDDGQASLAVVDVRTTDAGVYSMEAASSAGTVQVSAVLTVHGQCMLCVN